MFIRRRSFFMRAYPSGRDSKKGQNRTNERRGLRPHERNSFTIMERRFLQNTFKKSFIPSINPFSFLQDFGGAKAIVAEAWSSKRMFDVLLAVLLLVLAAPMMILIAVLVRL